METEKQKAEAYVRQQIPELMELSFGCEVKRAFGDNIGAICKITGKSLISSLMWKTTDHESVENCEMQESQFEIIGHPIQLQHWLRVFKDGNMDFCSPAENVLSVRESYGVEKAPTDWINFNLTTGQPATEADFKAFNEIVNNQ